MCRRRVLANGRSQALAGPPGMVLVVTVLVVGLLLIMGLTLINLASSDYQVANNESRSIQALYNADAGTEEAKMRLSPNAPTASKIPIGTSADWRAYILSGRTQAEIQAGLDSTYGKKVWNTSQTEGTTNYFYYNSVQTGTSTIPWGWLRIQHKYDVSGNVVYQDALTGAQTTTVSQVVGTSTVYNQPILIVTAEGIKGSVRRMIALEYQPIVSTTTTTTEIITDPFSDAMHGRGNVPPGTPAVELIGNASTDSYDSRNGAYNVGGNRHDHGDVSTDDRAAASVTISSNSSVSGSVLTGPGSAAGAVSNSGTISGTISEEPTLWNLPLSTIPAGVTNQGALSLSGNTTRTLNEGTYWFSSISITGNGRLETNGAVKIYVTGSISIGGNGVGTAGNLPPNLLIYGTRDPASTVAGCTSANCCTSVDIVGNGNTYAAVYAPNAAISVSGNGQVFGALTGNTVRVNGSSGGGFHYDEALGNLGRTVTTATSTTATTTGYTRYSWREIAF